MFYRKSSSVLWKNSRSKKRNRLTRGDKTASPDSVRHGDEAKAGEHPNMKGAGLHTTGELVWQYSVPQVPSGKQRTRSIEPHSADKVARTARASRTKPESNINDSQEKSSLSDDSSRFPSSAKRGDKERGETLRHNPLDTVARLREVMRLYRFDNVEIVDRPESFSEAALDAIARHGFSPSMVRGFYDSTSDMVYFNAARLSPSEVPGVVFHELVAHKGLREVLAPDAFHSMLDSVSSRHGGEARFREIAERYHLDLETENGRREAAEEYIAHLAEERNEALKPSWWREFLAQVKQLLRRLPYLDRVRWSDREIEALLRRSARAMRRRNRAGSNRDAGMFFAVNENGETLFHITGRDNAMTAQEIIDDPTISPDDFVLTSEGSEIWGEITPEMVEKAGEKSGIKALPIKLQKGMHFSSHSGFGLAHLYTQHGKELEGKHYDLSALLTRIFGKPYQVYVSSGRGNIRLEMVTRNRPREIGVLELQEENGFYSVITAYQLSWDRSKVRGKLVWQYSVPQVPSDKQQAGPIEPLSADKVASTARLSRTKPDSNINDSQEKSSLSDDSSHFSIAEDLPNAIRQKFSSGKTSLRQVASGFRKIDFEPGTVNLDLGGGKFDEGTRYLAERGVTNLVFDPVNRSAESNRKIFEAVKSGGVDTVTCNNVLNVIGEAAARDNVILQAAKALKPGGTAYFTVYEGDGSGNGRQSQADAWQENRKTSDYLDEIRKHFADVSLKNKVITARSPQVEGKFSFWSMDATFENPVRFSESGQAEELANLMAKHVAPIIRDANGRDSDVREEVRTLLSQEGFDTPIASGGDNSLLTFRSVALYSLQNRIHDNDGKPDRQKNQSVPEGEEPYHQGVLRTLRHQHRAGQPARTRHRQPEFERASPHQPDAGNLALLPLSRGDRQRFSDPPPRGARTHSQPRRKGCRLFQPHPRPAEVRRRTPPHGAAPRVRNQRRVLPAFRGGDRLSGPRRGGDPLRGGGVPAPLRRYRADSAAAQTQTAQPRSGTGPGALHPEQAQLLKPRRGVEAELPRFVLPAAEEAAE